MDQNRSHQAGLVARIRDYSRQIKKAIKAGDVGQANALASARLQIVSMARASGCSADKMTAALRA